MSRNRRLTWEPTGEERPSSRPEMTREGEEGEQGEEGEEGEGDVEGTKLVEMEKNEESSGGRASLKLEKLS